MTFKEYGLIFWEPTHSVHKTDLYRAVASARPFLRILVVCHSNISNARAQLGWSSEIGDAQYDLLVSPSDKNVLDIIVGNPSAHHIVCGVTNVYTNKLALKTIIRYNCNFSLMMEPRVYTGVLGILRIFDSLLFEYRLRRKVKYVFGIGIHSSTWFRLCGYDVSKFVDFGYFINTDLNSQVESVDVKSDNSFKCLYFGRFEQEKGVQLLLNVCKSLKDSGIPICFDFYGAGSLDFALKKAVCDNNLQGFVKICDAIPFNDRLSVISQYDLLVVPSKSMNDGWGVVVNDALIVGTPVLLSNMVGASGVIRFNPMLGTVIYPTSTSLRNALLYHFKNRAFYRGNRIDIAKFSQAFLSPSLAAHRLLSLLEL